MAISNGKRWLHELAAEKERHHLEFAEAIDVKASIVLVLLVFLADGFSGHKSASSIWEAIRAFGGLSLVAAAVLCIVSLWPRTYRTEDTIEANEQWISDLEEYYAGNEQQHLEEEMANENYAARKEWVAQNAANNRLKMQLLSASFRLTVVSLAVYGLLLLYAWN